MNYKCKECKKSYSKLTNESIKTFQTWYKFYNVDLNKFFLLLRKRIYPYEYIDSRKKFNENTIPPKEAFYSELNLKDISDADYVHVKKVWESFEIKNLGEYHDFFVQCETLLLADVFENFRDNCIEIYELDPADFLSAPGLAWQAYLKKTKVELELLTNFDMLLMIEKGIRGGICQSLYRHAQANHKYLENYVKSIESSFIEYLDANDSYG